MSTSPYSGIQQAYIDYLRDHGQECKEKFNDDIYEHMYYWLTEIHGVDREAAEGHVADFLETVANLMD